ncbi:MAG TPA: hypothetical protein DCW83_05390 [Saprospirales bacterium]|jgi:hypothetical protein|nr:hypothetical protein [Saprospiraceae bacterium]HAW04100.1 hypothetical protein [Saprospirales bacterium]
MSTKSNNLSSYALIGIILLLGLNGYQLYINSQLKQDTANQKTELIELEKIKTELDQDYKTAIEGLDELRGDNKELNQLIDSQKLSLQGQKEKINNLIWSKRELGKARKEMKALKDQAQQYIQELTKLRDDNQFLTSSNTQLKEEKEALNQLYAEIAQAREILIVEKEEIIKEKAILSGKVDIAEAIKINYMEVQGYQVKDDGKTKKKNKAKNINMLRTCFLTETNVVAKGGEQEFYIRIINPVGETIADSTDGAGVLTNKLDNTQVMYTTSGSIDYQNEDTRGCISLSLSEKLTKGIYDVEIYNNGFMVGKGDFKLK